MPLVPFFTDLLPAPSEPVAPKLPALTTCLCQDCEGTGYQATDEYDARVCPTCDGWSVLEVCSVCGERPEVTGGVERCGCNALCENCGNHEATIDGCCSSCWHATEARVIREEDPNLKRWEDMKDRDMTPSEVADQMREAEVWGWI